MRGLAGTHGMRLYSGTSGFSYQEWHGAFYPEDLPAADRLAYYAARLPAVEINQTFYRVPRASQLAGWAAQVPDAFRFAVKASRKITHLKRLADVGEETQYLIDTARALGEKLGPLLFQLPPNLKLDLERFDRFLEHLPAGTLAALEARHASWRDDAVLARLRERGIAWVITENDGDARAEILATAPWLYLRLRRTDYDRAALAAWATQLRAAAPVQAFAFFKHEDGALGTKWAMELLAHAQRAGERRAAVRPARRRTTRAGGE
jgi:uncharacterized protein YecE (DUF72 family)